MSKAVQDEETVGALCKPLSPLSAQDMARLCVEANKVAYRIQVSATKDKARSTKATRTCSLSDHTPSHKSTEDFECDAAQEAAVELGHTDTEVNLNVEGDVASKDGDASINTSRADNNSDTSKLNRSSRGVKRKAETPTSATKRRSMPTFGARPLSGQAGGSSGKMSAAASLQRNANLRQNLQTVSKLAIPQSSLPLPGKGAAEVSHVL